MGLFRRRNETYNEQMLRAAGIDPAQLLGQAVAEPVAEPEAPSGPMPAPAIDWSALTASGIGPDEWDACVTVTVPGLPGDRIEFTTLANGDIIVGEEEGNADLSPLADAAERNVTPPYRAVAARQDGDLWAVGAKRVELAQIEFPGADTLELSRRDSWDELRVDGELSGAKIPELERLGRETGPDFYLKAERLDGDLWEVRASAL